MSLCQQKVCIVKGTFFPVVMYGCESWTIKKAEHWRTDAQAVVLENTPESPLDCKEIKPVDPKGNQPWLFTGRTDAEIPILWLLDEKNWPIGKDPDAGKDWRREEKRTTEDEIVGWITDSMDISLSKLPKIVKDREAWHAAVLGVAKSQTQQEADHILLSLSFKVC